MTVCSSAHRKKRKMSYKIKLQKLGGHDEFLNRITKTLYYGKLSLTDRFSLPVSELAAELFSEAKSGCSLDLLHVDEAAEISRNACVSPCSLVLALLYLERLKTCNSEYIERVAPSELFLVSMMVASKFLNDDGEEDEVYNDEWAASGGLDLKDMNRLEREFLNAINWKVYVSEDAFWARLQSVETALALRQGQRRGWFSYMELSQLVATLELLSLAQTFITVSAVCLTGYTASVLAMVGCSAVVHQMPAFLLTPLAPTFLPLTTPGTTPPCLGNQTLSEPQLLWRSWDTVLNDTNNQSTTNNTKLSHFSTFRTKDHVDLRLVRKNWLTKITDLVRIASSTHHGTVVPIELLSY